MKMGAKPLIAVTAALMVLNVNAQGNVTGQVDPTDQPRPAYDVVSIKVNNSGLSQVDLDTSDRSYTATNTRIKQLLEEAYGIKENLIFGVPDRLASVRFDIQAKLLETRSEVLKSLRGKEGEMVRAFLLDRFALKAHTEIRVRQVYDLVVAPKGPKLTPSASAATSGTSIEGTGPASIKARNLSMDDLARFLSNKLHDTVLDKTNVAGRYDMSLTWSSDYAPEVSSEDRPSLFTALREQLGLKLKSSQGPVEILAVDHIEMPTPN